MRTCKCLLTVLAIAGLPLEATAQVPASKQTNDEIFLAQGVLAARHDYEMKLGQLRDFYQRTNDVERQSWVEEELLQYRRILKRSYRLELDIPPPTLAASTNIPQANALYRRAMSYKDQASGMGNEHRDNCIRAELLLEELLTTFPKSDIIAQAAYQLGDLYENWPFHHYRRAATYFERSFEWEPRTNLDGRLRAARLYDKRLSERAKAIKLYREVILHGIDSTRLLEAEERLRELSKGQ